MKIALINENSQAAKNAQVEEVLKKVVEPKGHEVFNYGMYLSLIHISLNCSQEAFICNNFIGLNWFISNTSFP